MVVEMLAADELCPTIRDALRATGFLVRNFKLLSREQWMQDTVEHTAQAFLGVTLNCARCHDHMYDPISQKEYYRLRAIFEPHHVRIDRVPGQLDTAKDGLPRVYDKDLAAPTYLFIRGDERTPDKEQPLDARRAGGAWAASWRSRRSSCRWLAYSPEKARVRHRDAAGGQPAGDRRRPQSSKRRRPAPTRSRRRGRKCELARTGRAVGRSQTCGAGGDDQGRAAGGSRRQGERRGRLEAGGDRGGDTSARGGATGSPA